MRFFFATIAGCVFLPAAALAEDCRGIHDDASRLACYDRLPTATTAIPHAVRNLDADWDLTADTRRDTFELRTYKPIYVLLATWTDDVNDKPQSGNPANAVGAAIDIDAAEAQFQLSFKTRVTGNLFPGNGNLWVGYTQSSRWQVYNDTLSRPFRETNYEPEAMMVFRTPGEWGGWHLRMSSMSLNHQSNGRGNPLSRSWNRVIGQVGLEKNNYSVQVRPWWRIPEDANDDNNPGIENYVGRGEVIIARHAGGHSVMLTGRHSLRARNDSRGSIKLEWGIPVSGNFRAHLLLFSGYGESLIDYNHLQTMVGAGVSLVEF